MHTQNQIEKDFNRAAKSYNKVALLQKQVALSLSEQISLLNFAPQRILDLGSGTGFLTQLLSDVFPRSEIIAVDFAQKMIDEAQKNCKSKKIQWVKKDMHDLSFKEKSFDLVVSSMSFQWSFDLNLLFSQINKILNDDGCLFFSMVGENSLFELKDAYQTINPKRNFKNFYSLDSVVASLKKSGINQMVMQNEKMIVDYDSVNLLIKDLKNIGANNKEKNSFKGLMGKNKWKKFIQSYPKKNGFYPATYNIFFAHGFRAKINKNHQRLTQSVQTQNINWL